MTAVDDAVLREAPLSIILDLRRKPIVEPLSPLLGPFQSRSQNGSFQEGAALLVPFRSRSQNGSFQVRSSFQEEAESGTPLPPDKPISKPKPKWSVPGGSSPAKPISKQKPKWSVAGPFFIPRESCSSSPAFCSLSTPSFFLDLRTPFPVLRRSPKVSPSPVSSERIDPFSFVGLKWGRRKSLIF